MKTGRRRKKAEKPEEEPVSFSPTPKAPPSPAPVARPGSSSRPLSTPSARPKMTPLLLFGGLGILVLCLVVCLVLFTSRAKPATYVPATAEGSWTANVKLLVPQTVSGEGWRSDCEADTACAVVPGTCQVQQRTDKFTEVTVDEYDDYAYNIYYEEAEKKLYEASGNGFAVTELNPSEDWVEGDRHYVAQEWLDEETCQYTEFAVWITDPDDDEYDIEVLLSECEVWDHVVVKERVYEEDEYCQTETVGSLAVQDTLTQRGTGAGVGWPQASVPANGELEREFDGVVIFRADSTQHRVTVHDVDKYVHYLTVPHYLGLDEEGRVIAVTDRAP
jgi:hypothetical protein